MNIYSKVDSKILLHSINRFKDIEKRKDISPENEFIQVASFKLNSENTFFPHKHLYKKINYDQVIAQESWVIVKGKVDVHYYDLDDSFISTYTLNEGDCSITYRGGHTYTAKEDGTIVYEFKTGPYYGKDLDKIQIEKKH